MSEIKNAKSLGGMMDALLVDKFTQQIDERGGKIKRSLAAAVKLWIELPADLQGLLLDESLQTDSFIALVRKIVDDRIQAGRRAGLKLVAPPQQTQIPKGRKAPRRTSPG